MRVKDAWPVTAPLWLEVTRIAVFGLWAFVLLFLKSSILIPMAVFLAVLVVSSGQGIEVKDGELILRYGGFLRFSVGNIREVVDLGGVRMGVIARHVVWELVLPLVWGLLALLALRWGSLGQEKSLVVAVFTIWAVFCLVILLVPLATIKENAGKFLLLSLVLPWITFYPFGDSVKDWQLQAFMYSLFLFLSMTFFVSTDHLLVSTEGGEFVIACFNARKTMLALVRGHEG